MDRVYLVEERTFVRDFCGFLFPWCKDRPQIIMSWWSNTLQLETYENSRLSPFSGEKFPLAVSNMSKHSPDSPKGPILNRISIDA